MMGSRVLYEQRLASESFHSTLLRTHCNHLLPSEVLYCARSALYACSTNTLLDTKPALQHLIRSANGEGRDKMQLTTLLLAVACVAAKAMPIASSASDATSPSDRVSQTNPSNIVVEVDETIATDYSCGKSSDNDDHGGARHGKPITDYFSPGLLSIYHPGDNGPSEVDPSTIKFNACKGRYRFVLDRWYLEGGGWDGVSSRDEAEGSRNLWHMVKKCGIITGYRFWFPEDRGDLLDWGWKAEFNLPVGQQRCLEKTIKEAAGYGEDFEVKPVNCHYNRNLW
ncbi:hypothetical protein K431DRAFT_82505 [Polychaeton citri CBS 116435]|uniref:Uncharacterized protein n=1 Tax=Polychaeton citri CBS 116435 TaxID=1314669 RepID=A0A9P4UV15_9PEZI|nr:hypothetical protein K431DRAFT_82505 [Polychaeton citri CBS 116435]